MTKDEMARVFTMVAEGFDLPFIAHLMGMKPDVLKAYYEKAKEFGFAAW